MDTTKFVLKTAGSAAPAANAPGSERHRRRSQGLPLRAVGGRSWNDLCDTAARGVAALATSNNPEVRSASRQTLRRLT
jgi:hypothetical protein